MSSALDQQDVLLAAWRSNRLISALLIWRILDEERLLKDELPGYADTRIECGTG